MTELPEPAPNSYRPAARPRGRSAGRPTSPLARAGFAVFAVGLLAVVLIMVLFATGSHDLPLWLNLAAMLAPIGFGIGLLGVFGEARSSRPTPPPASGSSNNRPGLSPSTGRN